MPPEWKPIPLIGPTNENVDDVQVDQSAATLIDGIPVMVEGKLHIVKRPGLAPFVDLGTALPIDGLYWWDKQQVVLAVSAGRVWKITDSAGTKVEVTGSTELRQGQIVTFADDGTKCVMANGGKMVHTNLATLTTMADPDAPIAVSHVAMIDGYLHANEVGTGKDHWAEIGDLTNWLALSFFSAESDPDDLVAMKVAFREIIALGRQSVEFWVNDGVAPFSRIPGSAQPYGTEAPYSLAQVGGSWMWLDQSRRLVTMQGRQVVTVSSPYDRVIQRYVSVSDAVGYAVSVDGYPLYLLNFPPRRRRWPITIRRNNGINGAIGMRPGRSTNATVDKPIAMPEPGIGISWAIMRTASCTQPNAACLRITAIRCGRSCAPDISPMARTLRSGVISCGSSRNVVPDRAASPIHK